MHRRKHHATPRPPRILHKFFKALFPALRDQRERGAPQAALRRKIFRAHLGEPDQRIFAAVVRAMHIGPLIVARRVDERTRQRIEPAVNLFHERFGRRFTAALGIAAVHRKRGPVPVDLLQQAFVGRVIFFSVRHAAKRHERKSLGRLRGHHRRTARGQQPAQSHRNSPQNTSHHVREAKCHRPKRKLVSRPGKKKGRKLLAVGRCGGTTKNSFPTRPAKAAKLYQRPLNSGLFGSRERQRVDGSPLAGARGYLSNQSLNFLGD